VKPDTAATPRERANRRVLWLGVVASLAMLLFAYALQPIYRVMKNELGFFQSVTLVREK